MNPKTLTSPRRTILFMASACLLGAGISFAQTPAAPAATSLLGQVESIDATAKTLKMKIEDGSSLTVSLAEKATVVKVAPGEKSLQNAAPIEFAAVTVGDRVLVRGGSRADGRIDGALRVVVMAKTDLAARDENDQKAWRERGIAGTVASANASAGEFIIHTSAPPAAPGASPAPSPSIAVDASKATLHRYADTSVKFADAKPAAITDMTEGDQVRILGTRSEDGKRITAERVVFGSFKTMALAIEKVDADAGVISVKDLESNKKFTISVVQGGTIRRIPAEMGQMLAAMSGGGAGRPGMRGGQGAPNSGGAPTTAPGGNGGGMGGPGRGPGGPGGPAGGPGGRGRGMEDMVDRMPSITLADLKKDDWIGAVVGKVDASGKAVAFNMLAGIEVFASRSNRNGGVEVGMPAGLLEGAFGMQ
jgi:hypothetical protein